LIFLI
jgi:Predicted exonuclease